MISSIICYHTVNVCNLYTYNGSLRLVLLLSSLFQRRKLSTERLSDSPKVTQLVGGRIRASSSFNYLLVKRGGGGTRPCEFFRRGSHLYKRAKGSNQM